MRIIENLNKAIKDKQVIYSFEYFPPKTEAGVQNLYARIDRMGKLHPAFIDVTWGAGGTTSQRTLEIISHTQNLSGLETMMHLTCTNMSKAELREALKEAKKHGIQNILALRGDPAHGTDKWESGDDGFSYAIDLVRFIREEYGDEFGICVAAYPEGHVESDDYQKDLKFLKEKVDAGADFIITQLFYEAETFLQFTKDCREIGITCPIVPGIMPLHSYASFRKVTNFGTRIPKKIMENLLPIKNDDEAVKAYGIRIIVELCQKLIENGVYCLHFYTMNLEQTVTHILNDLNLIPENVSRTLPWRQSANAKRNQEDVRPIFWANRPKSYLARTLAWDDFPNGRWGDSRSPAFGEMIEHHVVKRPILAKKRRALWGEELKSTDDIYKVFTDFCQGKIELMPWFESKLASESSIIQEKLLKLNQNGLLTINSQPKVNAASSEDSSVGWGGEGGYVYQKAYVEFFLSEKHLEALRKTLLAHPYISFHAVNHAGVSYTNNDLVNAVTWGVFPGKEIIQPTVVDPESFMVWKDEAFSLWLTSWATLYSEESESYQLLETVHNTHFLVNIVDNDFINGDIWGFFDDLITRIKA